MRWNDWTVPPVGGGCGISGARSSAVRPSRRRFSCACGAGGWFLFVQREHAHIGTLADMCGLASRRGAHASSTRSGLRERCRRQVARRHPHRKLAFDKTPAAMRDIAILRKQQRIDAHCVSA
jgi:hypothetical protein